MPKIQRKTQKVFCNSADSDQLAVFGSMSTGTPVYSSDVEELQSNEAFDLGWDAATLEDKAPFMEEMNGVQYGLTYQIAYGLQEGIPEYDSATTYYIGSICKVLEDGKPILYTSLTDDNIGNNPVNDSTNWERLSFGGGGLEIGDVGFTQMAIDESKGKRRYLNGQVIIQDQYVQFTNIIKNSVALNPDLACTEAEWQTELTMSANGVCYKFVIDDNAGTIRLPKYPEYLDLSINGAKTVSVYGNGKTLGLTNGTKNFTLGDNGVSSNPWPIFITTGFGSNYGTSFTGSGSGTTGIVYDHKTVGVTTNASKSGLTGSVTTSSEKIKGTYFIQVATGAETEDNIINEIELNNPFSLLDYKYSEYELNNLSWLCSEGQYNSKAVYPAVYDLLLKIYNGTKTKAGVSVKSTDVMKAFKETGSTGYHWLISTETPRIGQSVYTTDGRNVGYITSITSTNGFTFLDISGTYFTAERNTGLDATILYSDYDFVLNTAEETFRLPIKVKQKFYNSGNVPVVGNGKALGLICDKEGGLSCNNNLGAIYGRVEALNATVGETISGATPIATSGNEAVGVTTNASKSGLVAKLSSTEVTDLYLYFYVGETVQNANLVNIGRIQEQYTTKSMVDGQWVGFDPIKLYDGSVSTSTISLDISDYLPNDGYNYEVLLTGIAYTGATSGNRVAIVINSSMLNTASGIILAEIQTRTASSTRTGSSAILPVGVDRIINIVPISGTVGTQSISLYAYRRIGTNL